MCVQIVQSWSYIRDFAPVHAKEKTTLVPAPAVSLGSHPLVSLINTQKLLVPLGRSCIFLKKFFFLKNEVGQTKIFACFSSAPGPEVETTLSSAGGHEGATLHYYRKHDLNYESYLAL